ncbi:MAG TPA: GDSL-type esterase/lipase family protein [Myxococcaceae bacterium]|nr:GDSL-type esterase/lipase family protein [Myxococcaceae bacterium]
MGMGRGGSWALVCLASGVLAGCDGTGPASFIPDGAIVRDGGGGDAGMDAGSDAGPSAWFRRDTGVKIMPLGDSITEGSQAELGGYRWPLENLLVDAGYDFDYVGSLRVGSPAAMPRPWHEGHGGYQIESVDGGGQLAGPVVDAALRTYQPDVILLLAGTNNLNFPDTLYPDKTSAMYDRLLAQIFTLSPGVGVVASPVPWKTSVPANLVEAFNDRVHGIVDRYADAGYRITWVAGMTDAIDGGVENLPDGLHPSQPAYGRMAEQWFRALESVSGP